MKIDRKLIEHVADVARIKLTDDEIREFLPQLKEILAAFSEIQNVDTGKIKPSFHPIELRDSLREDIPLDSLDINAALSNTQHRKESYFKGPKVL